MTLPLVDVAATPARPDPQKIEAYRAAQEARQPWNTLPVSPGMYGEAMEQLIDPVTGEPAPLGTTYKPSESVERINIPLELAAQMPTPLNEEQAQRLSEGKPYIQRSGTTFVPTLDWKPEISSPTAAQITPPYGGDFQQGGVVPGMPGEPRLIRAEGGEIVIPNSIRGEHMLQPFGVWRPPADVFAREVTRPFTRALLPTHKVPGIRFRSPQTIRRMTPTQRAAFQANVEQEFGVPWEDWSMQERMSTDIGGPRRQRAQFRRPSFVRG